MERSDMVDVFCDNTDCRWYQGGCCGRGVINIFDGECEDFEDYHNDIEWKTPYWKRCGTVGMQCKVKFFGKKIERDGIAFFVDMNVDHAICTEESSGLAVCELCDLDGERIGKMKNWLAAEHPDFPPLESLPTAVYKNGKLIPVEKKEETEDGKNDIRDDLGHA
jgi:hypothetical protein